jgi:hypothetical protein
MSKRTASIKEESTNIVTEEPTAKKPKLTEKPKETNYDSDSHLAPGIDTAEIDSSWYPNPYAEIERRARSTRMENDLHRFQYPHLYGNEDEDKTCFGPEKWDD